MIDMRANFLTRPSAVILFLILVSGWAVAQSSYTESEFGYKMGAIRGIDSALQSHWSNLGTLEKSFFYIKRAIPLWSWLVLCHTVEGSDPQFFLGECLDAGSRHLLRLPATQFRSEYLSVLDELWSSNPLDALTFSSATIGYSSNDTAVANIAPILHLGVFAWASIVGVRHIRRNASIMLRLKSIQLKRAFWIAAILWITLSILLRVASVAAPFNRSLLNLQTIVLVLFGAPAVVLGLILLVRMLRQMVLRASNCLYSDRSSVDFPIKRWQALVKYDDEVAAAARSLQHFGDKWVDKLGEEFFALNEDRKYLRPIASRLLEEAQRQEQLFRSAPQK
ncbi:MULTISPECIES: hypothetical protein [unclassified Bradyrhizobium]|uniref:hypothetical protein n=1 Tax=unclassified Bradyrhizobium TaxID=2631580 RepID=UPI002916C687|nr:MULTISPECIES: hypothetical protein [unclassified Bradyrhizobium]